MARKNRPQSEPGKGLSVRKSKLRAAVQARKRRDKKRQNKNEKWEPFVECILPTNEEALDTVFKEVKTLTDKEHFQSEAAIAAAAKQLTNCRIYKNNLYHVAVYGPDQQKNLQSDDWPPLIHLSIKKIDRSAVHNWSHMQRIKNELVGDEHEAIELYPAESRLVNMANQYHLWVLANKEFSFPFGFAEGRQVDVQREGSKAKQNFVDTRSAT